MSGLSQFASDDSLAVQAIKSMTLASRNSFSGAVSKWYLHNMLARPLLGRLSINSLLALAGIVGPLVLIVAEFAAARSVSTYSPVRDSISSLAWTPMGWVQTVGFLTMGLLVEVFTVGLFLGMRGARGFRLGVILLVFFGFGLLLLGAFRTDVPGLAPTVDGTIHGLAANTAFILLPIASLCIAPSLKQDSYWRPLLVYTFVTAAFAIIWIAIYRMWLPQELSWFGLYERILVFDEIVWVELMATRLLRLSLGGVGKTFPATEAILTNPTFG